ncbi:Na(+) H(+) antiporter subunit D [Alkalibacterium sp. AK22]|uniref:complex I subunit 5 family protein n=1 Tax=Alkalibacterium sp. AK22 TaxID=1229520 RepID=UPI00044880E3|nr:proton-conducting transporter membrane subunit [Alkalibacterium sp. AK22]EXJ22507.1 Na(+) H(+) antiporter subunit D [Alkalibacterium sp. AK22]
MLYLLVIGPILAGIVSILFKKRDTRLFIVGAQIVQFIYSLIIFIQVRTDGTVFNYMSRLPEGVAITLMADIISSVFVLLTTIIFLMLMLYAFHKDYFTTQFGFLFLVLQGLIISLFFTTDLFNIFVMLEVATVVVAILIMINKEKQAIYDGMIYFFVNVIGTAFLLLGIGMLYRTTGLLDMRAISEALELLDSPRAVILPFAMMMTTLSLKTAVVPLFSWLPKAHGTPSAPPVVSAVLSGLFIKTGVYMFIRFSAMFEPVIQAQELFFIIGFITSIFGFIMALSQNDIKMILAYSTVSQIGLIMIGLNMGSDIAYWGALFHVVSHALFKSTLFLAAGQVYNQYGTRDIRMMRGVLRSMPLTGMAIIFGILGVTGAPMFNGSISKYMISYGSYRPMVQLGLNLINLGTIMYFLKFSTILFGKDNRPEDERPPKEDLLSELLVFIMGGLILLTGVYGPVSMDILFGYQVEVFSTEYFEKGFVYALMIIAAIGLYNGVINKGGLLDRISHVELTFNAVITSMTGFFIFVASYVYFIL